MKYRPRIGKNLCPYCGKPKDRLPESYCRSCYNAYARANRPKYSQLSDIQRRRNIIRSIVGVYKRRGKILANLCFWCGSQKQIQLHHPDIDRRPKFIIPLCLACHRLCHGSGYKTTPDRVA